MSGFKRLPNNYGSVSKLSGKRRKPFCAKKYVGSELTEDGRVVYKYRVVGTYETRREALAALSEANQKKERSELHLFGDVMNEVLDSKEGKITNGAMNNYRLAAKRFEPIADMPIAEVGIKDLEKCINGLDKGYNPKKYMKTLASVIYRYAIKYDYCQKNLSTLIEINEKPVKKLVRIPFTKEEIDGLDLTKTADRFVMIGCYTGMRLTEIIELEVGNIDLENMTIHDFGIKTEAGRNRTVPIHEKLQPLISQMLSESIEKGVSGLFMNGNAPFNRHTFERPFEKRFPNHTTHDCRHTFATNAYACRMNAVIVKLILGHSVRDLTLGTYTHITLEDLRAEMERYKIV